MYVLWKMPLQLKLILMTNLFSPQKPFSTCEKRSACMNNVLSFSIDWFFLAHSRPYHHTASMAIGSHADKHKVEHRGNQKKKPTSRVFFSNRPSNSAGAATRTVIAQQAMQMARKSNLYYTLPIAHCLHSEAWPDCVYWCSLLSLRPS